jgi:hypothetical protein
MGSSMQLGTTGRTRAAAARSSARACLSGAALYAQQLRAADAADASTTTGATAGIEKLS